MIKAKFKFLVLFFIASITMIMLFQNCSGVTVGNPLDDKQSGTQPNSSDGDSSDANTATPINDSASLVFTGYDPNIDNSLQIQSIRLCIQSIGLTGGILDVVTPVILNAPELASIDPNDGYRLENSIDSTSDLNKAFIVLTPQCGSDGYTAEINLNGLPVNTNEQVILPADLKRVPTTNNSGYDYVIDSNELIDQVQELVKQAL